MEAQITFETKKDLPPLEHHQLLQFKGMLIQRGYTEIIHISDKDEDSHLHYFTLPRDKNERVRKEIVTYLSDNKIDWCMIR